MYIQYNPNPEGNRVGDCTVRALSKALDQPWSKTYLDMCVYGLMMSDMPSANNVWGCYLKDKGFTRRLVEEDDCTVKKFAESHKKGTYILAISGHVVCLIDGCFYDSWDSSECVPIYYWSKT